MSSLLGLAKQQEGSLAVAVAVVIAWAQQKSFAFLVQDAQKVTHAEVQV